MNELENIKPFLLDYVNEVTQPSRNGGKITTYALV